MSVYTFIYAAVLDQSDIWTKSHVLLSTVVVCPGHVLLVIWPHTRQLKHHILNQCSPSHPSLMLSADNDVQCKRQPSRASQWPKESCRNSLRIPSPPNLQCAIHVVGEHVAWHILVASRWAVHIYLEDVTWTEVVMYLLYPLYWLCTSIHT